MLILMIMITVILNLSTDNVDGADDVGVDHNDYDSDDYQHDSD